MELVQQTEAGVLVRMTIQPRASRDEVTGLHGDRLRVRLTSPPVDGAANKALVSLVAKIVGVRRADVRVVSGLRSRRKDVVIAGADLQTVRQALGC